MMKMRHILYISLVLIIAGCTNEENFSDTLSGKGKTPLLINATINTERAHTRASGENFVNGDVLKAYFRHLDDNNVVIGPDYGKKLVTITYNGSNFTSDSYWDDFSNSSSTDTDIRTSGHSLQSFYGYCYNGGSLYSLTEATGVLTWTVGSENPVGRVDQSTATKVQNADLLWSPTQAKIPYIHGDTHDANHGLFDIPYTHAMSQVTVKVIADNSAGFVSGTNPLASTKLILNAMNINTRLTAPSSATPSSAFFPSIQTDGNYIKNIKMYAKEPYPDSHEFWREFVAIVAPGTKLKEGEQLLEIIDAHGNNYTVTITAAMLSTDDGKWGNGLSGDQIGTDGGKQYIVTQPGVNYHLDVTIKKSAVQAHSSLANWTDVNATANGDIYFPDDVDVIIDDSYDGTEGSKSPVNVEIIDKDQFKNNASFSLFRVQATNDNTDNLGNNSEAPKAYIFNTRRNEDYTFESISTFTNTGGDPDDYWTNAPELYWPNNSAKFYYRALAKFNSVDAGANNITYVGEADRSTKGTSVSQGTIATGHDILWGTTPKHYGSAYQKTYQRGYPIPPRTHGVPIVFEHAMSKVSFTLETTNDASVLPNNAKMELSEASFKISNLYTAGTIRIDDGNIDLTGSTSDAISANKGGDTNQQTRNLVTDLIVVPQTLGDDVIVTITFTDSGSNIYSTYTIPLNQCVVSDGSTPITAWERGKNYSYTIRVEKEAVQFHALVKDWENVTGSGTASLVW